MVASSESCIGFVIIAVRHFFTEYPNWLSTMWVSIIHLSERDQNSRQKYICECISWMFKASVFKFPAIFLPSFKAKVCKYLELLKSSTSRFFRSITKKVLQKKAKTKQELKSSKLRNFREQMKVFNFLLHHCFSLELFISTFNIKRKKLRIWDAWHFQFSWNKKSLFSFCLIFFAE